jgi:hypothetical protein
MDPSAFLRDVVRMWNDGLAGAGLLVLMAAALVWTHLDGPPTASAFPDNGRAVDAARSRSWLSVLQTSASRMPPHSGYGSADIPLPTFVVLVYATTAALVFCSQGFDRAWGSFRAERHRKEHSRTSSALRTALLTSVFFWLFHVPSFYVETRSWATTALVLGIFLLPHLGSRFITGWLDNGAGSSVLIAGLFHSMHNAIVNSTGLVAVVALPQFEVLVIHGRHCCAGCGDHRGGYARPSGTEAIING